MRGLGGNGDGRGVWGVFGFFGFGGVGWGRGRGTTGRARTTGIRSTKTSTYSGDF